MLSGRRILAVCLLACFAGSAALPLIADTRTTNCCKARRACCCKKAHSLDQAAAPAWAASTDCARSCGVGPWFPVQPPSFPLDSESREAVTTVILPVRSPLDALFVATPPASLYQRPPPAV